MPVEVKLRRTSGKTWAKLRDEDLLTKDFLKVVGESLLKAVVFEARKDLAKQGGRPTPPGVPEGIPASEDFFKSFSYRVEGQRVLLVSTWPFIEQITEGRREYPMTWLTQQEGVSKVPMKGSRPGTVVIKSTPTSPSNAWIHPGFRKHNFIRRGYERARREMDKLLADQVGKVLSKTPIL